MTEEVLQKVDVIGFFFFGRCFFFLAGVNFCHK